MLHQSFVTQPSGGINYLSLFEKALRLASFNRFDAAVAYATIGGVVELDKICTQSNEMAWKRTQKRWLVGIDFCRTQPLAIRALQEMENSTVKIHEGIRVVKRKRCIPLLSFHPKTFILEGDNSIGAICGSGNLSLTGMTKGHEIGTLVMATEPSDSHDISARALCRELQVWFDDKWQSASSVTSVISDYEKRYADSLKSPTPTDEDGGLSNLHDQRGSGQGKLTSDDLSKLRACENLWIEAGNITPNLGEDGPGNQLMMKRMTRAFFGFPSKDEPKRKKIGEICIVYSGVPKFDCSLRFAGNSMDVLSLPIPGRGGPTTYDQQILLFKKASNGHYILTIGSATQKREWIRRSTAIQALYHFAKGKSQTEREWGVF